MEPIKSLNEYEQKFGKANVSRIPRRTNLSSEEFQNEYFKKGAPVILEGQVNQWPAVKTWNPNFFKEHYPEVPTQVILDAPEEGSIGFLSHKQHLYSMKMNDTISLMQKGHRYCRSGDIPIQKFPGIEKSCNFDAYMGHVKDWKFMSIWIGGGHTSSSLHWDPWHNFLVHLYGLKYVVLFPPSETKYLYPFDGYVRTSQIDPLNPDYARFPKYRSASKLMVGELKPGDLLYFPFEWWHHLWNEDVTIGLNCFFGDLRHQGFLRVAATCGLRQWAKISKDFITLGLLGNEDFERFIRVGQPTGRQLYRTLVGILERRISWLTRSHR